MMKDVPTGAEKIQKCLEEVQREHGYTLHDLIRVVLEILQKLIIRNDYK